MSESNMSDGSFSRLFIIMILAMSALAVALMFLASGASSEVNERLDAQHESENSGAIVDRIAPVGTFAAESVADAVVPVAQAAEELSGEEVYKSSCAACHAAGIAGAPAVGNVADWAARLAQGVETLYDHAINGYQGSGGYMPAKGGNASLSDDAVKAAVDHILANSK